MIMNQKRCKKVSQVERVALEGSGQKLFCSSDEKTGVLVVDNFPSLGKLAALYFLEWAQANSGGVVSLPTQKVHESLIDKHKSPLIRATQGFVFLRRMSLHEFYSHAREIKRSTEAF